MQKQQSHGQATPGLMGKLLHFKVNPGIIILICSFYNSTYSICVENRSKNFIPI